MPAPLPWVLDDGGRAEAGFRGLTDDCVTRAIAIVTGRSYREVYDDLHDLLRSDEKTRLSGRTSPRNGVHRRIYEPYLATLGWRWTPTMKIGQGTVVHLREGELPGGRIVVAVSKHLCAVIDGVVHDTHDPTRDGTRAVYGYYSERDFL